MLKNNLVLLCWFILVGILFSLGIVISYKNLSYLNLGITLSCLLALLLSAISGFLINGLGLFWKNLLSVGTPFLIGVIGAILISISDLFSEAIYIYILFHLPENTLHLFAGMRTLPLIFIAFLPFFLSLASFQLKLFLQNQK